MKINKPLKWLTISIAILLLSISSTTAQGCLFANFRYTIGLNGEVKFEDLSSSPNGNVTSWKWSFGDGAISTVKNPTHRYNLQTMTGMQACFDVSLTVNDGSSDGLEKKNICIPVSTQIGSGSLYVTIKNPIPLPDASCPQTWIKAVAGQLVTFEGDALGGVAPYIYEWDFGTDITQSRKRMGQGPHNVTFKASSGISCSKFSTVTLTVRDANGLTGSALVQVNSRDENQGPGKIEIKPSRASPCIGQQIYIQAISNNPFGYNGFETYEWDIDGVRQPSNLKKIYTTFTKAGQSVIKVRVTDNSGSYSAQWIMNIKTADLCNDPDVPVSNFEIWVGDTPAPNGTLTLDGNNPCGAFNEVTGKSKIVVKVPQKGNTFVDGCLGLYFFVVEIISQNGCSIKKIFYEKSPYDRPNLGGGIVDAAAFGGTSKEYIGFVPTLSNGSLLYPLPICFYDCAPLIGCNLLKVSVGRFRDYGLMNGSACPVFPDGANFPYYNTNFTNENYVTPNGTSLAPFVKNNIESKKCAINVKDNYTPLSIVDINTNITSSCTEMNLSMSDNANKSLISGGMTRNPLETVCSKLCNNDSYKSYMWKAYDYYNPNKEISIFKTITPADPKKAVVDKNNVYFTDNFKLGQKRLFFVSITVADWDNNIAIYTKLVDFDGPPTIKLPSLVYRCPGTNVSLSDEPIVVGGKAPYSFNWSSGAYINPIASNEENPLWNLTDLLPPPDNTDGSTISLVVSDASGCTVSKSIKVKTRKLTKPQLPTAQQYVCGLTNIESVKKIGPITCTESQCNSLGGSGSYRFRWEVANLDPYTNGLDNISDPTVAFPTFRGTVGTFFNPVQYKLFISDLYGGCNEESSNVIKIQPVNIPSPYFGRILMPNFTLCPNLPIDLNIYNPGSGYYTIWESTNPKFKALNDGKSFVSNIKIPVNQAGTPGSTYNYKVSIIDKFAGCVFPDNVNITLLRDWIYTGYESVVAPAFTDSQNVPLWSSTNNQIYFNGVNNSGAVPNISVVLNPSMALTAPQYDNGSLKQATWTPTPTQNNIQVKMTDWNGCSKTFSSNTYYFLSQSPDVTVTTKDLDECRSSTSNICFDVKLDMHVYSGGIFLPKTFTIPASVTGVIATSGGWVTDPNYSGITKELTFTLIDATNGIYTGNICFVPPVRFKDVGNDFYNFTIIGGLPNSGLGNRPDAGRIYRNFRFSLKANLSGIRTVFTQIGTVVKLPIVAPEIASNLINIGDRVNRKAFIMKDQAFRQYNVGRTGTIDIQYNVSIQPTVDYFYAGISKCISASPGFKSDDDGNTNLQGKIESTNTEGLLSYTNFSVFPNPFSNSVNIKYSIDSYQPQSVKINIYDISGRVVETVLDKAVQYSGEYSLDFESSKLNTGVYFFEYIVDKERFYKKLVKIQ